MPQFFILLYFAFLEYLALRMFTKKCLLVLKSSRGFTLIELLVVIAIIGALSAVIIPSINSSRSSARVAAGLKIEESIHHSLGGSALVGDYLVDDCSGTTVKDNSGYNNGTVTGTPTWTSSTASKKGCGLTVSTTVYTTAADVAVQDPGLGSMTWTLWFKTSTSGQQIMYKKTDAANANGITIQLNSTNNAQCILHSSLITVSSPGTFNDGSWHHVVCTLDRTNALLKLFIDGRLLTTASVSSLAAVDLNSSGTLYIGYSTAGLVGNIDAVRIYSTSYPDNY
jgi:prepilin-type N-terminal cleavage/methylation domain-containing protein